MSIPSVLVPLYTYPTLNAWAPLTSCAAQNPSVSFTVVINPDNGPGASNIPNDDYVASISDLNTNENIKLLGYITTAYGSHALADCLGEVATYANWASYTQADIHVDGIFFDQTPSQYSEAHYQYLSNLSSSAKATFVESPSLDTFNPGTNSDPQLWPLSDEINSIETGDIGYAYTLLNNIPPSERPKQSAIINNYAGSAVDQNILLQNFVAAGIGGIFITTAPPGYHTFSHLWTDFCTSLANMTGDALRPAATTTSSSVRTTSAPRPSSGSQSSTTTSAVAKPTATNSATVFYRSRPSLHTFIYLIVYLAAII
ncbi:hypothetical protein BP6252_13687 [Coleophoma cylindrospora]|uniref:Spherulin 4-like cell surface protein n=1 Tax=Coleophoma cylindrospora TaxID=1849047 RepID=A0A3D8Q6Y9_9HELO|nr:hypothetical protein BP6252_13687 [Coleophoma cylindrospora]